MLRVMAITRAAGTPLPVRPPRPAPTSVFKFEEVVGVSADLPSRLIVGRNLITSKRGHRFRQEGLLDQASNLQLLFDALPILGLLLLLGHGALLVLYALQPSFRGPC